MYFLSRISSLALVSAGAFVRFVRMAYWRADPHLQVRSTGNRLTAAVMTFWAFSLFLWRFLTISATVTES